jgi:2-alkyl-3-oxoalkanoate reductase
MKVLVTGADDFIAGTILAKLAACDWAQACADDRPLAPALRGRISAVPVDATDEADLARVLPDFDAVVHCSGPSPRIIEASARALYGALARLHRAPRVVHLSSMTVYGGVEGIVTEGCALNPELGAYAAARVQAEQLASGYGNVVILRPGVEYGPGGQVWTGRVARWLRARRLGDLGVAGDGICNLVHVEDVADAAVRALQAPELGGQAFNLVMDSPPTWNAYFTAFAIALGAVPVRRVTPRWLAIETRLLAPALKLLELACARAPFGKLHPPPAIPPSLLRLMRQDIRLSNAKAKSLLAWRPRSLSDGLNNIAGTDLWTRG